MMPRRELTSDPPLSCAAEGRRLAAARRWCLFKAADRRLDTSDSAARPEPGAGTWNGSTAAQFAVARGARVIGAASAANQSYLSLLGAEPVSYGEGMAERVRALAPAGVDVALDVAGNGVLPQLIELAGGPQNVVTLADFDGAKEHGVHCSNGFVDGNAFHSLAEVGELIETRRFWLPVDKTFPLAAIAEAHRVSEHGRVRGRLVLVVG